MTTPSGHRRGSHTPTESTVPHDHLDPDGVLWHLVALAEQSIGGASAMLALRLSDETWRWIGGEYLQIDDVCRERLLAGACGNDLVPDDDPDSSQPDLITDTLTTSPDEPSLRWIAARIDDRAALIACEREPWEPDERTAAILSGFALFIRQELRRQDVEAPHTATYTLDDDRERLKDLMVNSARDGVIGIDAEGNCHFINETGAAILSYDPTEIVGRPIDECIELSDDPENPHRTVADEILQFRDGTGVNLNDAFLRRRDGSFIPVEVAVLPNIEEDGRVSGGILRFTDVTDRKTADIEARHREARHQAFLEMTLDSIVTIDQHGRIVEFNPAAEQTYRCSFDEVVGEELAEILIPPPWRGWFRNAFETFAESGGGPLERRRVKMTGLRADGSTFPSEVTITRLPSGSAWVYTLYIHDLTERKWNDQRRITRYSVTRILAEVDSPKEALPRVLETICKGLEWDWAALWMREPGASDMKMERSWYRESAEGDALQTASQAFTFEPGQGVLGNVWVRRSATWIFDLHNAHQHARRDAALECHFQSMAAMPIIGRSEVIGIIEMYSHRHREPDEEMLRLFDSLGSQLGQFIERKQVEEERVQILAREQKARTEAEAAERRLAFLAEASAQLSASLDYEVTLGNVARLAVPKLADYCAIDIRDEEGNIASLEIADIDPEKERIGRDLNVTHPIDPESDHPVAQVIRTGRPILYEEVTDDVLQRFSNANTEFLEALRKMGIDSAMYVPLIARGRTLGVISFVSSESGQRYGLSDLALAQELARRAAQAIDNARLYREAQDAVRVREEFLSIASHELKTPLTTVKGYSQILSRLLRRPQVDHERLTHLVDQLQDQLGRFEILIADLLDISRIQQGRLELRPETTDLVQLARNIIGRFGQPGDTGPLHHLRLESPDSYVGYWDPDRLDQVVTNLVSNAVKYSPEGGEVLIRIEPRSNDHVDLSVADQGIGIPEDEQGQLFRPFARSETVQRAITGVGLGLYISHQIVVRHGGEIHLTSEPGAGSTFTVSLPREYDALADSDSSDGQGGPGLSLGQ